MYVNGYDGYRIPSGCAVFGVLSETGKLISGSVPMEAISLMRERSNGLGGGFAAYGIYPEFKNYWAFHVFYDDILSREETEDILKKNFKVLYTEEIPTKSNPYVKNPPLIYRYFVSPETRSDPVSCKRSEEVLSCNDFRANASPEGKLESVLCKCQNKSQNKKSGNVSNDMLDEMSNEELKGLISESKVTGDSKIVRKEALKNVEEDFIVNFVMNINSQVRGAYIISSGKNMGVFKGVGYPEDIGEFYKLDEYKGYLWTAHGRFPTNSVGWWGGAHPFGLLGWSVVHNGEISSYGTNRRFVEGFGYECTLSTDTEVITYLFDLLVRRQRINLDIIHLILASPLWEEIEMMPSDIKELLTAIRIVYGSTLINGPFSIIVGHNNFMYALNDRIKLRPLVAAKEDDFLFVSSEEASIRGVCKNPDLVWHPRGGEPVMGFLKVKSYKMEISKTG